MSPSVSFIKFLTDAIANNDFHGAHERLPEAKRLVEKMSSDERSLCGHTIEGMRKVYTQNFHRFNQFLGSKGEEKLQLIPVVSFFVIKTC